MLLLFGELYDIPFSFPIQALLANVAAMYAVYHGPHGLQEIASRVHRGAMLLAKGTRMYGSSTRDAY